MGGRLKSLARAARPYCPYGNSHVVEGRDYLSVRAGRGSAGRCPEHQLTWRYDGTAPRAGNKTGPDRPRDVSRTKCSSGWRDRRLECVRREDADELDGEAAVEIAHHAAW